MKTTEYRKICAFMVVTLSFVVLAACGSNSGGNNGPATTTLKGAVEFPAASASAKTTAKLVVTENDIAVEVYDLNGKKVASVHPQCDVAQTPRLYSYEVPGLTPKVDYVLKAVKTSTGQIVKKLIEKEKVVAGSVEGQIIDPVSTTAVVMAEKTLTSTFRLATVAIKLGEENYLLPAAVTEGVVSATIHTAVRPSYLENEIRTLATTVDPGSSSSLAGIDSQAKADLVNSYLIVNEAIKQNVDVQDFVEGTSAQVINNIRIIIYDSIGPVSGTKTITSTDAATTTSAASKGYTPPIPQTATTTGLTAAEYVTLTNGYRC